MEDLLSVLAVPVTAIALATFLAVVVEKVVEYIIVPLLDVVIEGILSLVGAATGKPITWTLAGKFRAVVVTAFGFGFYWLALGYDFMSGVLANMSVEITHTQGLVLSAFLVSGGSNFVHDTFEYVKTRKEQVKETLKITRSAQQP